jgi:hypothetical protein
VPAPTKLQMPESPSGRSPGKSTSACNT